MPTTYDAIRQRMDFLTARQGVLAGNIANADTPGYLSRDVLAPKVGESAGSFAMQVTRAGHISAQTGTNAGGARVVEDSRFIEHNGNSVRLDNEMSKMAETQTNYRLMTELYAKQVGMQKLAIGRQQ
jgi:flagellar basal-body rod protein FlgB